MNRTLLRLIAMLIAASFLAACSGAEAAVTVANPNYNAGEELHRPYPGTGNATNIENNNTVYSHSEGNENNPADNGNETYNRYTAQNGIESDYGEADGTETDCDVYADFSFAQCLYTTYENGDDFTVPQPIERIRSCIDPALPMIALTFDDGPVNPYTSYILDVLERYGARSTFFVIGQEISGNEDIIRRAFDMGNEIAGHSWSHALMPFLSAERVYSEIMDTHIAIYEITGYMPQIFRTPYGRSDGANSHVGRIAVELGLPLVNWNVDPRDWENRCAYTTWRNIMDNAVDGNIILAHDNVPTTAYAMEYVIPQLIEMGFQLVTVSELFYHRGIEPRPGFVYRHARP